jgi:hypothetical protein
MARFAKVIGRNQGETLVFGIGLIGPPTPKARPMSTSLIHILVPPLVQTVQTASAVLRARLARSGRCVWRALEAHGQARARRVILDLADKWEFSQPELARQLRESQPARPGSSD